MMKRYLVVLFAACTTDSQPTSGPPVVEDDQLLGSGKADGGLALGSSTVRGQQSGYRSDATPFSCTQGGTVEFDVTYENTSIPWGARLFLWRGMAGEDWCGGCEPAYHDFFAWSYHQVDELHASAPWTWSVNTKSYGYAAGAGGRFNEMKYVVRIELPDGSVRWDNGGSNAGYYRVVVPDPQCEASWMPWHTYDSKMQDLAVTTVHQ